MSTPGMVMVVASGGKETIFFCSNRETAGAKTRTTKDQLCTVFVPVLLFCHARFRLRCFGQPNKHDLSPQYAEFVRRHVLSYGG